MPGSRSMRVVPELISLVSSWRPSGVYMLTVHDSVDAIAIPPFSGLILSICTEGVCGEVSPDCAVIVNVCSGANSDPA